MNLHVFYIHISIMLLLQYALSKSLPEASGKDGESEVRDSSDDTESIHETNHRSFKHQKSDRLKGHIRRRRANEEKSSIKKQCAVMYKNDEPVGILQPYKDSYQFLPVHSDEHIPVEVSPFVDPQNSMKRETSLNTDDEDAPELGDETLKKVEDSSPFSDERYPYIFAKFKVDSRIEKPDSIKQRTVHKRESSRSLVDEKHMNSLSSTLSKLETNEEGAAAELRSILSDIGLIDDETHVDKREAELNEDEDLEHGTNKINLIKMENNDERPKREDLGEKPNLDEKHDLKEKEAKRSETATKHYNMIEIPEPKSINEEEYIDQYFNKNEDQQEEEKEGKDKNVEKRSDEVAAEMEREIKAKLQKIKEEVRNEIDKIKSNNNEEFKDDDGDGEQVQEKEKSQRRKRHVINTLVDEETSDINPVINADNRLIPHIRRRRKRSLSNEPNDKEDDETDLPDINFKNVIGDISVDKKSENHLVIDLIPEIKVSKRRAIIRQKRRPDEEESMFGVNETMVIESKSNEEHNRGTFTDRSNEDEDLNGISELENLEHGHIENRTINQLLTIGHLSNRASSANQYFATTEKRFLIRSLKEYDEELSVDDNDNANNLDLIKDREKKSCHCGDKGCKCGKLPASLLIGADGSNFVYVDGVPRLVEEPVKETTNEKEQHDKNKSAVKLKLQPFSPDKRRQTKNDIKSRLNFHKSLMDGGYTLDIDPDIYRIIEENSKALTSRKKRNSFADLVEIHGGSPIINHLVAIRERSMLPRIRVKRNTKTKDQTAQQLTLTDMSDEDLFGALPQSFEGELARFKRVKRTG